MHRLRQRWQLVALAALGVVAVGVTVLVTNPWALVLWGAGVLVAVGTDLVKGGLQRRLAHVFAPASPLTVSVRLNVGDYVRIPGEMGTVSGAELVPRSGHEVRITVETNNAQAVILNRMVPVVVARDEAPRARVMPQLGVQPVRSMQVWLSEDPPRLSVSDGPDFPYRVTPSDPEILSVTAHVTTGCVRWYLELAWTCGGRQGVHRIDIDGEPFRTAGVGGGT